MKISIKEKLQHKLHKKSTELKFRGFLVIYHI